MIRVEVFAVYGLITDRCRQLFMPACARTVAV